MGARGGGPPEGPKEEMRASFEDTDAIRSPQTAVPPAVYLHSFMPPRSWQRNRCQSAVEWEQAAAERDLVAQALVCVLVYIV